MLAFWKKSYDQPIGHIKKQKHYFADKGPSSQSYGFPSSHVMDVRVKGRVKDFFMAMEKYPYCKSCHNTNLYM